MSVVLENGSKHVCNTMGFKALSVDFAWLHSAVVSCGTSQKLHQTL